MANNQQIHDLLTLSVMNLDPRIHDKRSAIIILLVELSLYSASYPLSKDEILSACDSIIAQKGYLNKNDCDFAIDECLKSKFIIPVNGKFDIAPSRKVLLQQAYGGFEDILSKVKKSLIGKIELEINEPLSNEIAEKIFNIVQKIVTSEVYEFSINLARGNYSIEKMLELLEGSEPKKKFSDELSKLFPDRDLFATKILIGILNFYKEMPSELVNYLKKIHCGVLLNQILNLDPSIVQIQKESFSKRKLYLDTNVVLSYLCEGHKKHSIVMEVIDASKKIGVQLFVSPATLKELDGQVARAEKNNILFTHNRLARSFGSNLDDAILATYLCTKNRQPSLEWKAFIAPFKNMEELMLSSDIIVEQEGFEEISKNGIDSEIRKAISEAKPPFSSSNVIDHDTLNCSLIVLLRKKYIADPHGQLVWLITIDSSLRRSQKWLFSSKILTNPYCMQISDWGDIVFPIQCILNLEFTDFIGYLAQARLGAVAEPEIVQLDFLETMQDAQIDIDRLMKLSPLQVRSTLIQLQTDRESQTLLSKITQSKNETEKTQLQLEFDTKLSQTIEESDPLKKTNFELNKRLEILEKKYENQISQNSKLSDELVKIKKGILYRFKNWVEKIVHKKDF